VRAETITFLGPQRRSSPYFEHDNVSHWRGTGLNLRARRRGDAGHPCAWPEPADRSVAFDGCFRVVARQRLAADTSLALDLPIASARRARLAVVRGPAAGLAGGGVEAKKARTVLVGNFLISPDMAESFEPSQADLGSCAACRAFRIRAERLRCDDGDLAVVAARNQPTPRRSASISSSSNSSASVWRSPLRMSA
jgi:hypothetical protein